MPELVDAIRRARARRSAQRVEFFERVPLDRWFEAFVTPDCAAAADAAAGGLMLVTFHDLTPLRRVEEMRADFVANASHELRTPLAALLGLHRDAAGPGARRSRRRANGFSRIMQAQATRMARLIDDLLSLSRIELNAHLRPDTPVDLVADRAAGGRRPADAGARPRRRDQGDGAGGSRWWCSATATN